MAAPETPSEPRSARRVAVTAVNLPGGDTIQFSFTRDIFGLSREARDLVYGIVDQLKAYEATLSGESQPAPHVGLVHAPTSAGAVTFAPFFGAGLADSNVRRRTPASRPRRTSRSSSRRGNSGRFWTWRQVPWTSGPGSCARTR